VRVDNTAPTLLMGVASNEVSGPFELEIGVSEALAAFTIDDLSAENASLSEFERLSDQRFTVLVTPEDFGTLSVSVAEGQVQDLAGNGNAAASVSVEAISDAVEVDVTLSAETDDPTDVTATVGLTNPGQSEVGYSTQVDVPWLTVSPAEGSLAPGSDNELIITVNDRVLEEDPGQLNGEVIVRRTVSAQARSSRLSGGMGSMSTAVDGEILARVPVTLTLEPRRGTVQLVATTPAGMSGDTAFSYRSDIEAFEGLVLTTSAGRASSAEVELERGQYSVAQSLPAGWRIDAISCAGDADNGSSFDLEAGVLTLDLDPEEALVCTIENVRDEDLVRLATQRAIRNFMTRRADRMIEAMPDLSERLGARERSGAGNFSAMNSS